MDASWLGKTAVMVVRDGVDGDVGGAVGRLVEGKG